MTPNTTPAPMTHEGDDVFIPKSCCIRADGACFEEGECLSDCEALDLDLLRRASERELRQRLERSERERNEWCTRAEALALQLRQVQDASRKLVAISDARIAELEAGIGRLASNFAWLRTHESPAVQKWAKAREDEALGLLHSLIGHKEGRE